MNRNIIQIDLAKCNGCGLCVPNCAEGALQIIDGKARLISDLFCDGLGACLGHCPQGAISIVEREAEPYDEAKVMEKIIPQGNATIQAHLQHLQNHNEEKLVAQAIQFLQERQLPIPQLRTKFNAPSSGGCPGALNTSTPKIHVQKSNMTTGKFISTLQQWPIQLKLLNPDAAFFDDADLLISADCVAHATNGFHTQLQTGKILIIFCPKLDAALEEYAEKLAEILKKHHIKSITVAKMAVPCCNGTLAVTQKALALAEQSLPIQVKTINLDGTMQA